MKYFSDISYAIQSVWSAIYCLAGDIDDYSIVRYFVVIHNTVGIIVCAIQIPMVDWLHKKDVLIFNMHWDMKIPVAAVMPYKMCYLQYIV